MTKKSVIIKHSGFIQASNEYTKLERSIFNVLLYNAYDDLLSKKVHSMKVADIKKILKIKDNKNFRANERIKSIAVRLMRPIHINITGRTNLIVLKKIKDDGFTIKENDQIFLSPMPIINIKQKGVIEYQYLKYLRPLLYNPAIYGKILLSMQYVFKTKHAQALYENCMDYKGIGKTCVYELPDLKRILVGEKIKKTYKQFKYFNNLVLKPAIKHINEDTDIIIMPELFKTGRSISGVQFHFIEKDISKNSKDEKNIYDPKQKYEEKKAMVNMWVNDILEFTGHEKSKMFYYKVAWKFVLAEKEKLIYKAISETKADYVIEADIKQNKASIFNKIIQRIAKENSINLGLKKQNNQRIS